MEQRVSKLLDEEIVKRCQELDDYEIGSKERSVVVEEMVRLHRMRMEEVKADQTNAELKTRTVENDRERNTKQAQFDAQTRNQWIGYGVQIGLTIASLVAYNVWFNRSLRFQETGTHYLPETKNLISRMLPGLKK